MRNIHEVVNNIAVTLQVSVLRNAPNARLGLLAGSDAVGQHVVFVQIPKGAKRGVKLTRIAGPEIEQGRQPAVFVEADRVAGLHAAFAPRLNLFDHAGLRGGLVHTIENPSVAAQGVRLQHGVPIPRPLDIVDIERSHILGIIGIHFHQRVEYATVTRTLIQRDQCVAHLRMRPTVESLGLIAFFPIEQRRAEIGLVHAIHDRVEPARIFRISAHRARQIPAGSRRRANRHTRRFRTEPLPPPGALSVTPFQASRKGT